MVLELDKKLDYMYEGIKILNGFCDNDWCCRLLYPYHLHFNDENKKYRDGSIIAFYGLLTEWEDQSGFPFYQGEHEDERHHFENYITAFMANTPLIKAEYPNVYKMIVNTLLLLDRRDPFEEMFPLMVRQLMNLLRRQLENDKTELTRKESSIIYKNAFKEIGIELKVG